MNVWPLVGRQGDLDRLAGLLDGGHTNVVLLTGPAGVGKSRLATEVCAQLDANGWASARAMASPALSALPLAALAPLAGPDRADLLRAGTEPAALFDFGQALVDVNAAGRKLVLFVDDVPHLDHLSVALIAQLAAAGSLAVIVTARDGDPIPDPIVALWTSDRAVRVSVPPLDAPSVAELLRRVLAGPVAHQATVDFHRLSAGNVLILRELVAHAREVGDLALHAGTWVLSGEPGAAPALTELISARLDQLGPDERTVIDRIACATSVPLDHFTDDTQRAALADLERLGIVAIRGEQQRMVAAIAHPQYAIAARERMSTLRRIDLLREHIAVATNSTPGPGDAIRLATWQLDAGVAADPVLLEDAVRIAALGEDYDTVVALAAEAARAGSRDIGVALLRADALLKSGRIDETIAVVDGLSFALAAATDDQRAEALITRARALATRTDGATSALATLDGASDQLPGAARRIHRLRADLLVMLAQPQRALVELELAGAPSTADEAFDDELTRVAALVSLTRTSEALAATDRLLAAAPGPASRTAPRVVKLFRANAFVQNLQLDAAKQCAHEALTEAIVRDDELCTRQAEITLATCAMAIGKLETAARWLGDVIAGARTRGPAGYEVVGRSLLAQVRAQQGQLDAARAAMAGVPNHVIESDSWVLLGWAWIAFLDGNGAEARRRLATRARVTLEGGDVEMASWLAGELARMGGATEASAIASELGDISSPLVGLRVRMLAALADPRAAGAERFADLANEWHDAGCLFHAAEMYAVAAETARRNGSRRDAFGFLGKAQALAEQTQGASTAALQFADTAEPLTAREREIALLAARGQASNNIATLLFLSPRTVNNHLQAVYWKLGVRKRTELASALGLVVVP